jgi:hypothetical protein
VQSFPDGFVFCGAMNPAFRQMQRSPAGHGEIAGAEPWLKGFSGGPGRFINAPSSAPREAADFAGASAIRGLRRENDASCR